MIDCQPVSSESGPYSWGIEVRVVTQGKLTRVSSRNHKVECTMLNENEAHVKMVNGESPEKDFLLYFRDDKINEPVGFSAVSEHGEQALMVNVLTDLVTPKNADDVLDSDQKTIYQKEEVSEETEVNEEEEFKKQDALKNNEYIFLIDRSGSMTGQPINLAVRALKVFLHSLPMGCHFNIYSFGSDYDCIFEGSALYSQDSLDIASVLVSDFKADMGGTELLEPLTQIFSGDKLPQCAVRHIFLLTDGAVNNTKIVVKLIRDNYKGGETRMHTFGIGSGVSTELVKNSAMAGQGHFYFINNMSEIDKKVLDALQREKYEYLIVKSLKFLD